MRKKYVWQYSKWPNFTWDSEILLPLLGEARKAQGAVQARAGMIGLEDQADIFVEEAFATSAIEGEKLNRDVIRSSVAQRLGLPTAGLPKEDRPVDGLVEMLIDATNNYSAKLTAKRLNGWHASLFPTGHSGIHKIRTGTWRTHKEPMQVVSGSGGLEKVHYEAPESQNVPAEIKQFLRWWNDSEFEGDGLLRAGVAHFWFVSVHPYEDGNGRISRALTDMAIAQDEKSSRRLYSLSQQIIKERRSYYDILERSQKQNNDLTLWLSWFLKMYTRAILSSQKLILKTLLMDNFWKIHHKSNLNQRQIKVTQKLLESEPQGFEGGINNKKYVGLTKTSRETAKRDLVDLEKKGLLKRNPGKGRSTSYSLDFSKVKLNMEVKI